jgi:hypothetical protein
MSLVSRSAAALLVKWCLCGVCVCGCVSVYIMYVLFLFHVSVSWALLDA